MNCTPETLTLTVSGVLRRNCAFQTRSCRHTSRSTQRSMATIRPVSSATGMNSPGNSPPSGCCQRTSASKPVIRPVSRSTIGW